MHHFLYMLSMNTACHSIRVARIKLVLSKALHDHGAGKNIRNDFPKPAMEQFPNLNVHWQDTCKTAFYWQKLSFPTCVVYDHLLGISGRYGCTSSRYNFGRYGMFFTSAATQSAYEFAVVASIKVCELRRI